MLNVMNVKRKLILCLAIIISMSFVLGAIDFAVFADPGDTLAEKVEKANPKEERKDTLQRTSETRYLNFLDNMAAEGVKDFTGNEPITVNFDTVTVPDGVNKDDYVVDNYEGRQGTVINWTDSDLQWLEFEVDVETEGLYNFEIEYLATEGTTMSPQRTIHIDDKIQYKEAGLFELPRIWKDDLEVGADPEKNVLGDEIRPKQVQEFNWQTKRIVDIDGKYVQPLRYRLTPGKHTIRLIYVYEPIVIGSIKVIAPEVVKTYEEVKEEYNSKGYELATQPYRIEGEHVSYKSDSSLRLEGTTDPKAYPEYKGYYKLNVIGKDRWSKSNQTLKWILDAPESGLYKVTLRMYQKYTDGLPVYRQIAVNGKVPFEEFEAYEFKFTDWANVTIESPEGEPYLIYLEKGENTFEMSVKLGKFTDIMNNLEQDAEVLSEKISEIISITSINPDPNFRYNLQVKIPDLLPTFQAIVDSFGRQIERIEAISEKRPGAVNNFQMMITQLEAMINEPESIASGLSELTNAQGSLSTWIRDFANSPLEIDYIEFMPKDQEVKQVKSNFFEKWIGTFRTFVQSFFKDYDAVAGVTEGGEYEVVETIDVWVSRGKEWAEVLKQQTDEEFTADTGINVVMNILPAGQLGGGTSVLLLALASGTGPDASLGVTSNIPVEYGMRDAVYDLSQRDDFQEVKDRFLDGIMVPFQFEGGYYGLPETMDFSALYYRIDVLEKYGLSIPKTWDDVYTKILPTLKKNGMDFSYTSGFHTFLYQNEGSYYKDNNTKSNLTSAEAYDAFEQFTNLYRIYGVPVQADFYNRFRTGQMPMGIGNFDTYIKLSSAAPEIYGKWDVAPIPGMVNDEGEINRASGGVGTTAAMILKNSDKIDEAWDYLKWYTSTETQVRYANDIRSVIGPEALWASANVEAFNQLPWDANLKGVIEEHQKWYRDMPNVIGGYITTRWIENARVGVVVEGKPYRPQLEKAVKEINLELEIKNAEFDNRAKYEEEKAANEAAGD